MSELGVGQPCQGNVKFLIDAAEYFHELKKALEKAKREILILGWDINGSIPLCRDTPTERKKSTLRHLIARALQREPKLKVRILSWDYSPLHSIERENLQAIRQGWLFTPRIKFHFDDCHPFGASHHQKIVVIDNKLAFIGGIDVTDYRWDTSEHLSKNPHRTTHHGHPYKPFHDVQAMVDGNIVQYLRDICRHRWEAFNGDQLDEFEVEHHLSLKQPDIKSADCRIVLTRPEMGLEAAVRDVEISYKWMIDEARDYVYVENQYLTSSSLTEHFVRNLSQKVGPRIIVILPKSAGGLLEQSTMGSLQTECLAMLRDADVHQRLSVFYPDNKALPANQYITVHSKVMIVDGRIARVGTSNLNDRSMGLDTESDLIIFARTEEHKAGIDQFLIRLLQDHTGHERGAMPSRLDGAAILNLLAKESGHPEKVICPFPTIPSSNANIATLRKIADPQSPAPGERLFSLWSILLTKLRRLAGIPKFRWDLLLTVIFVMGLAWLAGNYPEVYSEEAIQKYVSKLSVHTPLPVAIVIIFAIGGLLFLPINLLIVGAATVTSGFSGVLTILAATAANTTFTYWLGRLAGHRILPQGALDKSGQAIAKLRLSGIGTIILIRLVPSVPNSVLNFGAGITRINFFNFFIGTAIGVLPGITAIVYLQKSLIGIITHFSVGSLIGLIAVCLLIVTLGLLLKRRFEIYAPRRQ